MRVGSRVGRIHGIQQGVGSGERGGGPLIYWRLGGGGSCSRCVKIAFGASCIL